MAELDAKEVTLPDHIEHVLELVRDYGYEMACQSTGPEVAAKYQAIKEALKGGLA